VTFPSSRAIPDARQHGVADATGVASGWNGVMEVVVAMCTSSIAATEDKRNLDPTQGRDRI
jgi:hypothetical protein